MPPAGEAQKLLLKARVFCKDEAGQICEDQAEVIFEYTDGGTAAAAPTNREVMERYALVELAESAHEALKLERQGLNEQANEVLSHSITSNQPYLNPDVASVYQRLSQRMKRGMLESDRKQTHYDNYNRKRSKGQ